MAHGVPGGLGDVRAELCPEEVIHPLTKGEKGRVGKLRGFGNAISPQVAATFIQVVMQTIGEKT